MYRVRYEYYSYYYGKWFEQYMDNSGRGFTKEEAEACADHLKNCEEWTRHIVIEKL